MTDTTTTEKPEALRCAEWLEHIAQGGEVVSIEQLARTAAYELRRLHAPTTSGEALQIAPVNNDSGETMSIVRWQIETPAGWVGAHHKAPLKYLLAAQPKKPDPAAPADLPPRILALLQEVACRTPPEHFGLWEDGNGEPLQDDADAALAWIAARAKEGKA